MSARQRKLAARFPKFEAEEPNAIMFDTVTSQIVTGLLQDSQNNTNTLVLSSPRVPPQVASAKRLSFAGLDDSDGQQVVGALSTRRRCSLALSIPGYQRYAARILATFFQTLPQQQAETRASLWMRRGEKDEFVASVTNLLVPELRDYIRLVRTTTYDKFIYWIG